METTMCAHREKIEARNGEEIGTCSICHQVRLYNTQNRQEKPRLVKLGRINGMIILPSGREWIHLSREEVTELEAAKKPTEKQVAVAIHQDVTTVEEKPAAPVVPPRPKRRKQLEKYFEDNKEAILKDYYSLILKDFYRKWHISTAYWLRLRKSWKVQCKSRGGFRLTKKSTPPPAPEHGAAQLPPFPPFPPFNDNWTEAVQLLWLNIYRAVKYLEGRLK